MEPSLDVRVAAAEAIGQMGGEVLGAELRAQVEKQLIETLSHGHNLLRSSAAQSLGQIGTDRAVQPLIEHLKDESKPVREKAAEALGHISDTRALAALGDALRDKESGVSAVAAQALVQMGAAAVELLIVALDDERGYVRRNAASALVQLYSPDMVDDSHRESILTRRQDIIARHHDNTRHWHEDRWAHTEVTLGGVIQSSDCHTDSSHHKDEGIGVAFPV